MKVRRAVRKTFLVFSCCILKMGIVIFCSPTTNTLDGNSSSTTQESTLGTVIPSSIQASTATTTTTMNTSSLSNSSSPFHCPNGCSCSKCANPQQGYALICLLKKGAHVINITSQRNLRVCTLSLSRNNISRLQNNTFKYLSSLNTLYLDRNVISYIDAKAFNGLSRLLILNLDYNKLTRLKNGVFRELKSLKSLSIRFNSLKSWYGLLWKDTPKLNELNLEGNTKYIVPKRLLRNTKLQRLVFVSVSTKCRHCLLDRVNASRDRLRPDFPCQYLPAQSQYIFDDIFSRFILFKGVCSGNITCELPLTPLSKLKKAWRDACWEVMLKTRYFEYFLAVVVITANMIVVMVIVLSKNLRKSMAFCLIGHMSFCDLLIGIYAVGIAHGHRLAGNHLVFRQWRYNVCPYWRTVFMISQFMGVSTCLLITIERYLSIIFCMKPFVRLERVPAACLVMVFWILSGIVGGVIQVVDNVKITDNYMCILIRDFSVASSIHVTQVVLFVFIVVYVIIISMYIHIYVYVKRSNQNTGVQRESKLAQRIGLVVVSNMVFFVIPNAAIIIVTAGNFYFDISDEANSTLRRWLPPMCLVFNSCINPFLFAFRNEKFQAELKGLFHGSQKKVRTRFRGKVKPGPTLGEAGTSRSGKDTNNTHDPTITLEDNGLQMTFKNSTDKIEPPK